MSHTHSTYARGLEPGAVRTPPFESQPFAPYLRKASGHGATGPHGGLDSCDFDALDWLRFWLPESDWHIRRTRDLRRI
jgi:hypothetical protein